MEMCPVSKKKRKIYMYVKIDKVYSFFLSFFLSILSSKNKRKKERKKERKKTKRNLPFNDDDNDNIGYFVYDSLLLFFSNAK